MVCLALFMDRARARKAPDEAVPGPCCEPSLRFTGVTPDQSAKPHKEMETIAGVLLMAFEE